MSATFTREEILAALVLEPCHITGTHDPEHTPKFICGAQLREALGRLLNLLDADIGDLPRRIPDDTCGWCARAQGDERTLLEAWAAKAPIEFTLGLQPKREDYATEPPPEEPLDETFESHGAAWNRGCDLTRDLLSNPGRYRAFSVYAQVEGMDEPKRVGGLSR